MRVRQLLERSGPLFSPDTTIAVHKAFENAWGAVGGVYTGDAAIDEAAEIGHAG